MTRSDVDMGRRLDVLEEMVAQLATAVQTLAERFEERSRIPNTWNPTALTADQAGEHWRELAEWVGWLQQRYRLDDAVPGCWWRHSSIVDELTVLRSCWQDAFENIDARPTQAAEWLDRWLPGALQRIGQKWLRGCTADQHERPIKPPASVPIDDRDAYDEMARADVTQRRSKLGEGETTVTHNDQTMAAAAMAAHITDGTAKPLLDGSITGPVVLDGQWWQPIDDAASAYERVTDADQLSTLRASAERLAAADEAVRARLNEINQDERDGSGP